MTVVNNSGFKINNPRIKQATADVFRELKTMGLTKSRSYQLHLVFVGGKESRKLNSIFRGQPRPTNVLSFDYGDFGEILLAPYIIRKEAQSMGVSFAKYATRLIAHGALHLCGRHHEGSGRRAKRAEKTEKRLLLRLNIDNF